MDPLSSDLASLRIDRDSPARPSAVRRFLLPLAVVASLGSGGYVAFGKLSARIFKQEVALTEIAMISPAQSAIQVTSTGYVVPQVASKVAAKIPGRLAQVHVKEGDVVKAGALLATLADADQRSALAAAQARVQVSRARIETARANLAELTRQVERTRTLVAERALPRAQLEDLEGRADALSEMLTAARAEAVAAEAEANTLRVGLKDREILAPIDGTVITKPAAVGEAVGPGAPLVELADFRSLLVETDVPEQRLDRIRIGTPTEIVLDAYPGRRLRGVTAELGKRINRAKATVVVKVRFQDELDGILPDMSARVSFLDRELDASTLAEKPKKVVAASALVEKQGTKALFVVQDGKLRLARVTTGPAIGDMIELLDGPPAGTRVVRNPSPELTEGQRIKEEER